MRIVSASHIRLLSGLVIFACAGSGPVPARLVSSTDDGSGHAAASASVIAANTAVLDQLPFEDQEDFAAARRGFIASRTDPVIHSESGTAIFNLDDFKFQTGPAPDSVNPSLWRQAQLNAIHGLFEVIPDRVYQVRGYDLANVTFIAGDSGWIVIDVASTKETGAAAFALVTEHLGKRPVTGLIYTHSHIDHFGGAHAFLSPEEVANGVPVIAPEGFVTEAVSENVLAGNTMTRRASYMFGMLLPRGARGHVDSGLGKASIPGSFGLIEPNRIISETGTEITVDGVKFVFQNTPGAEAPAEMMIYIPEFKALCGAENVSHVMHNLYTLRGAKVRDALLWSSYLDETLELFGDADVLFASHHWPTWGRENILAYLKKQRDVYKYIHDQTLRLANHGLTPIEIAEQIELPPGLAQNFATRGYYGSVSHNSKAVYQHYFGWFDGNPANLQPLPPEAAAVRYVEFMGGAQQLLTKARASYEAGDYRWVATVLNHLVFAEPANAEARSLLADAYDQLAYQAESGPWRDFYLTGAQELRTARAVELPFGRTGTADIVSAVPTSLFFDALAVRLNGPKAAGRHTILNFVFTDINETHILELENAVLHHRLGEASAEADATMKLTRGTWNQILGGQSTLQAKLLSGNLDIDGSRLALIGFFGLLDDFEPGFAIVTP